MGGTSQAKSLQAKASIATASMAKTSMAKTSMLKTSMLKSSMAKALPAKSTPAKPTPAKPCAATLSQPKAIQDEFWREPSEPEPERGSLSPQEWHARNVERRREFRVLWRKILSVSRIWMLCQRENCRRSKACCGLGDTEPCYDIPGVREHMQQALRKTLNEVALRNAAKASAPAQPEPRGGA